MQSYRSKHSWPFANGHHFSGIRVSLPLTRLDSVTDFDVLRDSIPFAISSFSFKYSIIAG